MDWDVYFLDIADVVSRKSRDPRTKVGSVIVDKNNRIVGTGFNGAPKSFPKEMEDWSPENKHNFVLHAESNSILYARTNLTGCTIYVTHEPCLECSKMIISSGIRRVVYGYEKPIEAARSLRKLCGIQEFKLDFY